MAYGVWAAGVVVAYGVWAAGVVVRVLLICGKSVFLTVARLSSGSYKLGHQSVRGVSTRRSFVAWTS
jgi:hypothetical protein